MPEGQSGTLPLAIGPYVIADKLGAGGMAVVYHAYHAQSRREVALKVLTVSELQDINSRKRFEREAQTLLHFHHPHILSVYDFGAEGDTLYLAMRLLGGRSLRDLLQGRPLPPENAARIVRQVGSALDYAHARGVIHRDVKPGNVLFDDQGRPYLADFGVAFAVEAGPRLTETGAFVGTAAYASPEQCRGDQPDRASDIYSLAVMAFEMLTGELPFQGPTPLAVIKQHLNEAPRNPLAINPLLPLEVYGVLTKGLAKLPEHRYPSAMKFSEALDEALRLGPAPEPVDDESWLYDDGSAPPFTDQPPETTTDEPLLLPLAPPAPTPPADAPPFDFEDFEDETLIGPAAASLPWEDDLATFTGDLNGDFPTVEAVMQDTAPAPTAGTAPDFPTASEFFAAPVSPTIRRLPRRAPPPRLERFNGTQLAVYGSIILSLLALMGALGAGYAALRESGHELDATYASQALGVAFDFPGDWTLTTAPASLLFAQNSPVAAVANTPVPATGPYDGARIVVLVQRLNPVQVFSVPPACQGQVTNGPGETFACMKNQGFLVPVHTSFDTAHFRGVRIPGTLPPTPATMPLILLGGQDPRWVAVLIVHWDGYDGARDRLAQIARTVRPLD